MNTVTLWCFRHKVWKEMALEASWKELFHKNAFQEIEEKIDAILDKQQVETLAGWSPEERNQKFWRMFKTFQLLARTPATRHISKKAQERDMYIWIKRQKEHLCNLEEDNQVKGGHKEAVRQMASKILFEQYEPEQELKDKQETGPSNLSNQRPGASESLTHRPRPLCQWDGPPRPTVQVLPRIRLELSIPSSPPRHYTQNDLNRIRGVYEETEQDLLHNNEEHEEQIKTY